MRVGFVNFGERHDTRTNGQHYHRSRPPADQSDKLNGEVARQARHLRSIPAKMSRVSGVSAKMLRGNYYRGIQVSFIKTDCSPMLTRKPTQTHTNTDVGLHSSSSTNNHSPFIIYNPFPANLSLSDVCKFTSIDDSSHYVLVMETDSQVGSATFVLHYARMDPN